MNVLQILPELNVGGGETGTLDLAKYLVGRGHKAVVVSNGGSLVPQLEALGAIHYWLPVHKKSPVVMLKNIPRLVKIIRKEDIQIVHARSRVPAWSAYFACRRTTAVFVTTCHGHYKNRVFSRVMGWGKPVIAVSRSVARHMVEDFGVPPQRLRLVHRGVDLERFGYVSPDKKKQDGEFRVGIIGRITPLKGHPYFIKAMAAVAKEVPGLKVRIVGDAPASKAAYKKELQDLVGKLGLEQRTEFLGTRRDIPAILAELDLLVLATTVPEAFGRVIVEAQAAGVPVVATGVGGVIDIIEDGETGLLVPPANPDAMAAATLRVFHDRELSRHMSENARRGVSENYTLALMGENTLRVYEEALAASKILVVKFSALGDLVLATPALKAIREKFKGRRISLLVSRENKPVLQNCPYLDELLVYDAKGQDRGLSGLLRTARALAAQKFDLAIDLQNNKKSHLLTFLTGVPQRYGYDNKKYGFLLNRRIRDDGPTADPVAHQFRMLGLLGIDPQNPRLELWPAENDRRYIEEFLLARGAPPGRKLVGINLAASRRWAVKNWPLRHIARLCLELDRLGIGIVITGMDKDLGLAGDLKKMVPDVKLIDACGKTTVNQLACLIGKCAVYVTPDSAPLHIAASQNTPFVALFGPTDPQRHLPPAKDFVLIQDSLKCGPCYSAKCKTGACMANITPEEVLDAAVKILNRGQPT